MPLRPVAIQPSPAKISDLFTPRSPLIGALGPPSLDRSLPSSNGRQFGGRDRSGVRGRVESKGRSRPSRFYESLPSRWDAGTVPSYGRVESRVGRFRVAFSAPRVAGAGGGGPARAPHGTTAAGRSRPGRGRGGVLCPRQSRSRSLSPVHGRIRNLQGKISGRAPFGPGPGRADPAVFPRFLAEFVVCKGESSGGTATGPAPYDEAGISAVRSI